MAKPDEQEELKPGARATGRMVAAFTDKGYGFISPGPGRRDVFVRLVNVPPALWKWGMWLEFTVQDSNGAKLEAVEIERGQPQDWREKASYRPDSD